VDGWMQVVLFDFLMISGNWVKGFGLPHFCLFIGPPFPFLFFYFGGDYWVGCKRYHDSLDGWMGMM